MFNIIEKSIDWYGRTLSLQTGKIARQADGAVVASYGSTSVLATVVYGKEPNLNTDFFPLSVHYQDKYYAAGKIPGGFFKRESKPTEREILISRLIDRPIRPMFPEHFRNEVQIVVSVLSYDNENSVDFLSIIAASTALAVANLPVEGIVAGAKVGYIDHQLVINPTVQQLSDSTLELVVAGTKDGVLMVESEANNLSEDLMLEAVIAGHKAIAPVVDLINDFKQQSQKSDFGGIIEWFYEEDKLKITQLIKNEFNEQLNNAFTIKDKTQRNHCLSELYQQITSYLAERGIDDDIISKYCKLCFKELEKEIIKKHIFTTMTRIDGRSPEQIRPISTEVNLFQYSHGNALFTRGETQALVFVTLGVEIDEQIIDDIESDSKEHFMLHYNFPSYSVGETGRVGAPGRREIGHGKLAWRAIHPMLPAKHEFPYTIRVVSEITESNGSSSMATVCGASMGLMSAGVPLKQPVAGVAMGLIKSDDSFVVLSDILGDEDHLGDMDFKVAGTHNGITALQMDIKITSISYEIMQQALQDAHTARQHILSEMAKTIAQPSATLNATVPKMKIFNIAKHRIKELIGVGGKIVKEISEKFDVKIDINNNGEVKVTSPDTENVENAIDHINTLMATPEVGQVYTGKVVKLLEYGAFIQLMNNKDGLLHISDFTDDRNSDIANFLSIGDTIKVKIVTVDDKGKIKLTTHI